MEQIKLQVNDTPNRLDKYISTHIEDVTRSKVQKWIKDGQVLVNGEEKPMNYQVKEGDLIVILVTNKQTESQLEPQNIPIHVLYEDNDVLVIDKPKGMVVHPGAGNKQETLVNALLHHFKELAASDTDRPGIVHRIDKNTSGCLIVCKNDKAFQEISRQIQDKTCHREYIALVHGIIPHETGTINAPIRRSDKNRQKMDVVENGKPAVTHFEVLKRFKDTTLIKCQLETGRTHQIRVHMKYIKHPIVGDDKYAYANTRKDTEGQMLHAQKIEFMSPSTKEKISVISPLPEYFEKIVEEESKK